MNAIGYIRVSSDQQVAEGVSLDAQRAQIRAYCESRNFTLLEICRDEGISGKRADNRPGLQLAIAAACRSKAILVVTALDRLARSVLDCINTIDRLKACGAGLAVIGQSIDTSTPMGSFVFHIFAALGELERGQISTRTKAGLQQKRASFEKLGGAVPYGWKKGEIIQRGSKSVPKLEPSLPEQAILGVISNGRYTGQTYAEISKHLNELGIYRRCGKPWSASGIQRVTKTSEKSCCNTLTQQSKSCSGLSSPSYQLPSSSSSSRTSSSSACSPA